MWVIGGVRDGGVGEEAVVEEGAFEEEVNQRVEKVPDVEGAEGRGGGMGEEAEGGEVGDEEEREGGEQGGDGCLVNHGTGRGSHCGIRA